jgi:hypothetical protein
VNRPTTKPANPPSLNKPSTLPADRPSTKPGTGNRPGSGTKPGDRPGAGGLPSGGNGILDRPGDKPGIAGRPEIGTLPGTRPGVGDRPGAGTLPGERPGIGNRPGNKPWEPSRPDGRPGRPDRGDTFINTGDINTGSNFNNYFNSQRGGIDAWQNNRANHWDNWSDARSDRLNNFRDNRSDLWNDRMDRREDLWDHRADRRDDWMDWRGDVWDFRLDRADDIRDFYRDSYCHWFTPNWFHGCGWWPGGRIYGSCNPWWWWRPVGWSSWTYLWTTPMPPAVVYDYGTDIMIQNETVYVEGEATVPAGQYRQEAIDLAYPDTLPPPPVPASAADLRLIPLGVWALVQEEKGDAIMFYQLTATRDGLITGAYSNVLTGESAPVIGSIDKQSQRVAFRSGTEKSGAVIECNLNGLTKDQIGVFVHFGTGQTQEWLLVRMENPDIPTVPTTITPAVQEN